MHKKWWEKRYSGHPWQRQKREKKPPTSEDEQRDEGEEMAAQWRESENKNNIGGRG